MQKDTAAVRQQRMADELAVHRARIFNQIFSGPAGEEALKFITEELCGIKRQTPAANILGPTEASALYWSGRGDVGRAIIQIMEYEPRSAEVTIRRKEKDGQ